MAISVEAIGDLNDNPAERTIRSEAFGELKLIGFNALSMAGVVQELVPAPADEPELPEAA